MADAVNSTTAPVIPFPAERCRPPDQLHRALDNWTRAQNAALAVHSFRKLDLGDAPDTVRRMILEEGGGYLVVARILEETSNAIKTFRTTAAELSEVDRLIATAADRVLAEDGL